MAFTPARVRKAIIYRVKKLSADSRANSPVAAQTFADVTDLKQHALTTTERGNRFRYVVNLLSTEAISSLSLPLGNVRSANLSLEGKVLKCDISLVSDVAEGEVAWAVASLAQPALRPLASSSSDLVADGELDSALAMGHRIVFGGFSGSDASEMESKAALRPSVGQREVPYFDLADFNPIGLRLRENADQLPTIEFDLTNGLAGQIAKLNHNSVQVTSVPDTWQGAADLAALCATGRLVSCVNTPSGLNSDLAGLIREPLPAPAKSSVEARLAIQMRSVRQRRLAMHNHAGAFRLPPYWPSLSVLLVTNRVAMLGPALAQIAAQSYASQNQFEVLVGLHNIDSPAAEQELAAARDFFGDRLRTFHFAESSTLGEIYGALTERADGILLAKMDDDDLYGPDHLLDSVISLRYSGAGLFGRVPAATWLDATDELLLRPFGAEEIFNKYIIGGTMVMKKSELVEVGGWRPTQWAVDKALIDRFRQAGAGIYRASAFGWVYVRHNHGHTWEKDESHFRSQAEASWTGEDALRLKELLLGL